MCAHFKFRSWFFIAIVHLLLCISFGIPRVAADTLTAWNVKLGVHGDITEHEAQTANITFSGNAQNTSLVPDTLNILLYIKDDEIAEVTPSTMNLTKEDLNAGQVYFNVTGKFLGYSELCVKSTEADSVPHCIKIKVLRKVGPLDLAFTYSVAALATIIYVNMGAALDTSVVKDTLKKPIGPAIGFLSQFLFMPLISYGVAKLLIPTPQLQLGLFITGCSPGGGASNIWTLTLGGNLDLSITMTTISTFASFAMMPLWIFTLGHTIFADAELKVPYSKVAVLALCLIIPLIIGIFIRRRFPRVAKFLVRILRPFAVFLIVFIIAFAIYTNLFLFKLFTWQILVAGMLVPWLGYLFGGGLAWILQQNSRDIIAIAIETGVQNTGLAIFALRFSLGNPEADLTSALPVAVAIMTPIIPAVLLIIQKIRGKSFVREDDIKVDPLFTHLQTISNGQGGTHTTDKNHTSNHDNN